MYVCKYVCVLMYGRNHLPQEWHPTTRLLVAGACGGISFWAIALPFDTVEQ